MPFILRKIRKARWYKDAHPWLKTGELQADALRDLKTDENVLSVWQILDDKSNLERVVTALATTADNICNLDFALLNIEVLSRLGIEAKTTPGTSRDASANRWHLELTELSANKVLGLAHALSELGERERVPEPRVLELITKSVIAGDIEKTGLRFKERDMTRIEGLRATMESSSS